MACPECDAHPTCPVAPGMRHRIRRVALVGNPNVGKSTLFNALTRVRQRVGNYPGLTVERRTGKLRDAPGVEVIDLPGLYGLHPHSLDEEIAIRVLRGEQEGESSPDLVVLVVDATNMERNLVLALEVIETGLPAVVALNMTDLSRRLGTDIDVRRLSGELGVPVVPLSAATGDGISDLVQMLVAPPPVPQLRARNRDTHFRAGQISAAVSRTSAAPGLSITDRFDRMLTHRVAGPAIFLGILFVIFQAIFAWAMPAMSLIENGVAATSSLLHASLEPGMFRSLLADGVVVGVGAVLVFLPQILLLFLFVGLLEDSGYLSRAAFVSDRLMHRLGLSGQSIIPLVSGYACAVPAIMAVRTIPSHRDRLVTMLVVPLMSCSARLPIYALLIAALVPAGLQIGPFGAQGVVLFGVYLLSTAIALAAAAVLKRRIFCGAPPLMAMELPLFRRPRLRELGRRVSERGWAFVSQAGGIILLMTVVMWFLASFPRIDLAPDGIILPGIHLVSEEEGFDGASQIEQSYIGRLGRFLEPAMRPLGFDWKMTAGIITAFAARETFISTLATLYSVDDPSDGRSLAERMTNGRAPGTGAGALDPLVALSLLIFFMIACQCMSTLAVIRRETGTWRWPVIAWVYMTALAYLASLAVYQGGMALGIG